MRYARSMHRSAPSFPWFACAGTVAATALVVSAFAACNNTETHPGAAIECAPGVECTGIGTPFIGGGGGPGSDASTIGDVTVTEGGLAVLNVTGQVTSATSFTQNPSAAPIDTGDTTLYVQALQNVVEVNATVSSGLFSFTSIDNDAPNLTQFILYGRNTAIGGIGERTIFYTYIDGSVTTVDSMSIPAFDPAMISATMVSNSIPTTASEAFGTVIYQVLDASGVPISGIHAPNPGVVDAGTTAPLCPVSPSGTTV